MRATTLAMAVMVATGTGIAQGVRTLFDFETGNLSADWSAAGSAMATLVEASVHGPGMEGMGGRCLRVTTKDGGMVYCKPGKVPANWSGDMALRLFVNRGKVPPGKLVLDVMALDDDGKGQLWRRLDLEHEGWARVDMPLRFFGPGDGRLLRWNAVRRLGFRISGAAELAVDGIALVAPGPGGPTSTVGADELSALAWGRPLAETRVHEGSFVLLSDVPHAEIAPLAADLARVESMLSECLPPGDAAAEPPVLMVFRDEAAYRGFVPRWAGRFRREATPPMSDGYTMLGVALGHWDPAQGVRRPTFIHEFVHSVLEKRHGLPNRSEWFQEGMANRIQARMRPQPGLPAQVAAALSNPSMRVPWATLCNGQPVEIRHYWQTLVLSETLLSDPALSARLPRLIEAFRKAGGTDLAPHLGPVMGLDWESLGQRCAKHAPPRPDPGDR